MKRFKVKTKSEDSKSVSKTVSKTVSLLVSKALSARTRSSLLWCLDSSSWTFMESSVRFSLSDVKRSNWIE